MTTPPSSPVNILALTPPQILLKTAPVIGATIGVSIVHHHQNPQGMVVLFGPWQGQALYEIVHLFLNGDPNPISSDVVMNIGAAVELRLPTSLLQEGVNLLHCGVERPSGNTELSPPLDVLYHIYAPAGDEAFPGGGHSKLLLSISHLIIDATQAAIGVELILDFVDKHLYDLITVDCGGVILTHKIEPTITDPNPDLTKPIKIILTTPDFANGRNNPSFKIKYNVVSQLNNRSGTTHDGQFNALDNWSKELEVVTRLDQVLLEQPILREVLSDNNDKPEEVDLDKMNGGPLWALIHLIQAIWKPGDQIHLIVEAWVNGAVVGSYDVTITVGQVPGQISIDIPNVNVIAGSQLKVWYEQISGGKVIGISKEALAQVVGIGLPGPDMDVSPVHLSATRYYAYGFPAQYHEYFWPSNPISGSYIDRKATSVVGGITYSSSDTDIVSVDQNGRSYARANGVAIVTATDAASRSKSYTVTTSGVAYRVVFRFWIVGDDLTWRGATRLAAADGGRLFSLSELQTHSRSFTPAIYQDLGCSHGTWTSTSGTLSTGELGYWFCRWSNQSHLHADHPNFQAIYVYVK
ncbi:hypothetical protein ACOI7N_20675 [Pseudomonas sp. P2758]|uniref:hypothetical protein n=1 Tax=Pseudomonas sp. P2758 TaxID=3409916 RepID=UPI003B5C45D8